MELKEFLKRTGTDVRIFTLDKKYPLWDKKNLHNAYKVRLTRNGYQFSYWFYDSLVNTRNEKRPTKADVLSCLETYDVGSYDDFCREFGYDEFDKESRHTYRKCKSHFEKTYKMFSDVWLELVETVTDL